MFKCLEASKNVITLLFTIVFDVKKNVNIGSYRLKISAAEKTTENNEDKLKQALSTSAVNPKWYEIMSNNEYSDVTFISSDNVQIKSHRCVLSKHSKILSTIFKSRELIVDSGAEEIKSKTEKMVFLDDEPDFRIGKMQKIFIPLYSTHRDESNGDKFVDSGK